MSRGIRSRKIVVDVDQGLLGSAVKVHRLHSHDPAVFVDGNPAGKRKGDLEFVISGHPFIRISMHPQKDRVTLSVISMSNVPAKLRGSAQRLEKRKETDR